MPRGRYSRLADDDADDDSVALILGQQPPRLSGFRSTEYVQLEDLDDEGHQTEEEAQAKRHAKFVHRMRQSSHNLVIGVLLVGFIIVGTAVFVTITRKRHGLTVPTNLVLSEPLPRATLSNGTHEFNRTTLVVSLDGMHPHYVSETRTPNLDKFVRQGCAVPRMVPSFPTQTFPNHWTLVTGNYPINHGIVGNTFYDPVEELDFVNTDPEKSLNRVFWGGEPVWVTAKHNGLRSAVHMWPGSEVDWGKYEPDEVSKFNRDEPLDEKLAHIEKWLDNPPELMLAYVPTIDTVGHEHGISGTELVTACRDVDTFVGGVVSALEKRNLTDVINLIVLSDHGMAPTSDDRIVFLDDIVPNLDKARRRGWPLAALRFNESRDVSLAYNEAKKGKFRGKAYEVYKSSDIPDRFHFKTGTLAGGEDEENTGAYAHRLAPLYIFPEVGYSLVTRAEYDEMGHRYFLKGVHGYDNRAPLMSAFFAAQGPAFPSGKYFSFENVHVYSGICRSLGIQESSRSDGNFGLRPMKETITEKYPGVPFDVGILEGSTFEEF